MAQIAQPLAHDLPLDWRERLRRRLLHAPDHEHCLVGGVLANLPAPLREQLRAALPATLKPAAVLIPLIERPQPTVLLTLRASHLTRHAGQISFPGGRLEAGDADVAAAALRETQEEIGLHRDFIDPIGFLPDHAVQSGYRVTPVVALVQPGFVLQSDSREVAQVFELPLALALVPAHYQIRRRQLRDIEVDSWELPCGDFHIWGATAGMLMALSQLLQEPQ